MISLKATNEKLYDEVQNIQNAVYLDYPEALYRILEYDIIEAKPTLERL